MKKLRLQLGASLVDQDVGVVDADLASLLHAGGEDYAVLLLPHLDDEGLSGKNRGSEASLDRLELGSVIVQHVLEHLVARDAKGAQAVVDGSLKAVHLGEALLDVEGVVVSRQPVEERSRLRNLDLDLLIGVALGDGDGLGVGDSRVLEVLGSDEEGTRDEAVQGSLVVGNDALRLDRGAGSALVDADQAGLDGDVSALRVEGADALDIGAYSRRSRLL